jgi:5'-nucleotidase (lipoprotein e(P4) family)
MLVLISLLAHTAAAFETSGAQHLQIKWIQDSEEVQLLTTQVFKAAAVAVDASVASGATKGDWVVVLDIDETTLDTSEYWLDLATKQVLFDWAGWNAWCEKRNAPPVAGVVDFVQSVREAGGQVAWISNRHEVSRKATIDNLSAHGLWVQGDPMCLLTDDKAYTKQVRRAQLQSGKAPCGTGKPVTVLAYLGDTAKDLPEADEGGARADQLGSAYFVLPNPMYGGWEHKVTKQQ